MIDQIKATECNKAFVEKMDASMIVSYYKYGPLKENYGRATAPVSALKNLEARLKLFKETGNKEYLIDIANFARIEFQFGAGYYDPSDETDKLVGIPINEIKNYNK